MREGGSYRYIDMSYQEISLIIDQFFVKKILLPLYNLRRVFVQVYSVSQRYFSSSRDSLHAAYVNRGASELDLSRKPRRKDHLRGRFKLPNAVALTSSREPSHLHGPASTNHLNSTGSCNGTET